MVAIEMISDFFSACSSYMYVYMLGEVMYVHVCVRLSMFAQRNHRSSGILLYHMPYPHGTGAVTETTDYRLG